MAFRDFSLAVVQNAVYSLPTTNRFNINVSQGHQCGQTQTDGIKFIPSLCDKRHT